MRILVLGGGGREHAIVTSLLASAHAPEVICSPGNGGTAETAANVSIPDADPAYVVEWVQNHGADFVVIGPEAPLVVGTADLLSAYGVPVFGPKAAGAEIEGSKTFAKDLMDRHGIPTGRYFVAESEMEARAYLADHGAPVVVKADGLAAGKGVTVAMTVDEAVSAAHECFDGKFGAAGELVLIEEYLEGPECSLLAFTDGETVLPMLTAQDHKRALDNDEGPNTGGMGVYAPVPTVDDETLTKMVSILEQTVAALKAEGVIYRGVLYGGFILTAEGPKVLEYNARFGDPETQVLLPLLETDLVDVMLATVEGRLSEIELRWREGYAVSVVLASEGYPGDYETGKVITGIGKAEAVEGVTVYHAGTKREDNGTVVTSGGRVLNVTAVAPTFADARDRAYRAVDMISFEGMHYRTDIGLRALRALGEA
ncbi:MAG: phosphoribosylamine--glycine ligase [Actinobacteria bacterium]|nr:phosphoribosylamine--glycine ligase [Actinomycetota bacterium]